jgi:hypothetical protein
MKEGRQREGIGTGLSGEKEKGGRGFWQKAFFFLPP